MYFTIKKEYAMETVELELEILDEGRDEAEELNACCAGTSARQ